MEIHIVHFMGTHIFVMLSRMDPKSPGQAVIQIASLRTELLLNQAVSCWSIQGLDLRMPGSKNDSSN